MRAKKIGFLAILAAGTVLLSMTTQPVRADDSGKCDCWYRGWEDSLEYPLDQKLNALAFKLCLKEGKVNAYNDGFTKGKAKSERKCPYGN